MTGRMREAIHVQNLEESGRLASMSDNGMYRGKTKDQYDDMTKAMRAKMPWLPSSDRDIAQKQAENIQQINSRMKVLELAATMAVQNSFHKEP